MEAWGAFHLVKIFGLKFRKFSVSKAKAFSMRAKNLQSHWYIVMAQEAGFSASCRNENVVQLEG